MYIRFRLPQGAGGQAAAYVLAHIQQEVDAWAQRYQVRYTQKTIKYEHRVAFDHDETYTLWSMTWNPKKPNQLQQWIDYELVNVAGERY